MLQDRLSHGLYVDALYALCHLIVKKCQEQEQERDDQDL